MPAERYPNLKRIMQHIRIVDASKGSYREVLRLFDWKSFRGSDW